LNWSVKIEIYYIITTTNEIRDINTRNILVTPEKTCIVGDLGFAIATVGSKLMKNGHYESAEQASLQDVSYVGRDKGKEGL
jgi:hypothetical protein